MSIEKEAQNLLFQYELADKEIRALEDEYAAVFQRIRELEENKNAARDGLKRLLYTNDGPPSAVPIGKREHTWAAGEAYRVVVTYKKKSDYYDPAKLPVGTFAIKGIVTEVDKSICDRLAKKDNRIAKALTSGEWMTPSVAIPRLKHDVPTEAQEGGQEAL